MIFRNYYYRGDDPVRRSAVESVAKAIVRGAIERYDYDEEGARAWALDKIEWHNRTRKSVAFGLRHRLGREVNEYLNRFYG